jgi:catechol 2,3-dioxygenase
MSVVKARNLAHVVLRVRDADKSAEWYQKVLGLKVAFRVPGRMVFLAANENSSHELALMTLGAGAPPPQLNRVGLYHVGWQVDKLEDLEGIMERLKAQGVQVAGVGDHGISMGVYVFDPDGNELEIFYELPRSEWPKGDAIFMGSFPKPVAL